MGGCEESLKLGEGVGPGLGTSAPRFVHPIGVYPWMGDATDWCFGRAVWNWMGVEAEMMVYGGGMELLVPSDHGWPHALCLGSGGNQFPCLFLVEMSNLIGIRPVLLGKNIALWHTVMFPAVDQSAGFWAVS